MARRIGPMAVSVGATLLLCVAPIGYESFSAPVAGRLLSQAPVRVGTGVPAPTRTRHVAPVYPQEAQDAGERGTVILEVVIGTDGLVRDVTVLRSVPALDTAAIAAVKQWEYEPTVLDGTPVPVVMAVTVNFQFADPRSQASGAERFEVADGAVIDTTTRLEWTRRDSGAGMNWKRAYDYCRSLGDTWRLPSAYELEALYRAVADQPHAKTACGLRWRPVPGIEASCAVFWSSVWLSTATPDDAVEAWPVSFFDGKQTAPKDTFYQRALCVRETSQ